MLNKHDRFWSGVWGSAVITIVWFSLIAGLLLLSNTAHSAEPKGFLVKAPIVCHNKELVNALVNKEFVTADEIKASCIILDPPVVARIVEVVASVVLETGSVTSTVLVAHVADPTAPHMYTAIVQTNEQFYQMMEVLNGQEA